MARLSALRLRLRLRLWWRRARHSVLFDCCTYTHHTHIVIIWKRSPGAAAAAGPAAAGPAGAAPGQPLSSGMIARAHRKRACAIATAAAPPRCNSTHFPPHHFPPQKLVRVRPRWKLCRRSAGGIAVAARAGARAGCALLRHRRGLRALGGVAVAARAGVPLERCPGRAGGGTCWATEQGAELN